MSEVRVESGIDVGAIWHYGDPFGEQKALQAGLAGVEFPHLPTFAVSGPERLSWLNAICSQDFGSLTPQTPTASYILDPQGHLSHAFAGFDDGTTFWGYTEPGRLGALLDWLGRMIFAARVELADTTAERVVVATADPVAPTPRSVPKTDAAELLGERRAGLWAWDALRIEAGRPRPFVDTDERAIPNELANPEADRLGDAVHLAKGCYPGQETVARIFNLGRPPRRLVLLQLDGQADALPQLGAEVVTAEGRSVGRMGSSQRHWELGPIGLALLKRQTPTDAQLVVDGITALAEIVVDPQAGLHWRPTPGLGRR